MAAIKGRVRKFGDNIDTDSITPGSVLQLPMDEMKKYAFGPVFDEFYKTVQEGDVIVAGNNFGCGSSREQATAVVKAMGFRYILCESMARIYLRNCVGLGIYPILAKGISTFLDEGDEIEIDVHEGVVKNLKNGKTISFQPLSGTPLEVLEAGGILAVLKKRTEEK
jgi:3-isopropylmalate/(R)-2-methylmalate dehydratase small subunit